MNRPGMIGLILLLFSLPGAKAEVSVNTDAEGNYRSTIMMAIIEDPDPINGAAWRKFRDIPAERILNAEGHDRGDGGPHIAYHPETGWPSVVWAYNHGFQTDIAFSEWDGTHWTPIEFITTGNDKELDPRIFIGPDGTRFVTWWRNDLFDDVFVADRGPGSPDWSEPEEITSGFDTGQRCSVLYSEGMLTVVYERTIWFLKDLLVATSFEGLPFVTDEPFGKLAAGDPVYPFDPFNPFGGSTSADQGAAENNAENNAEGDDETGDTAKSANFVKILERMDALIHVQNGKEWIEWKSGPEEFSFSVLTESGWSQPVQVPWTDPTWYGAEMIRQMIRAKVLSD